VEELLSPQFWIDQVTRIWSSIELEMLNWGTAAQAAAIAAAFAVAFLGSRQLRKWLNRFAGHPSAGKAVQILIALLMPLLWLVLMWVALIVARAMEWPSRWLDIATGLLVAYVAVRFGSKFFKNTAMATLFVWTVWSVAALEILGLLDRVTGYLASTNIPGSTDIQLLEVVQAVLLLVILLWLAVYLSSLLEVRIRTSRSLSPSLQVLFVKSLKMVLVGLAIIIAVDSVGIDLTALAVFGGAIGVGVGFGLQKVVSNLISGVILLVDKSIKPGDVIAVAGTYGWVTALGGRYVSVVTRDGVEHLIPNEMLISERVENWTHSHSRTRLKVDVGIHYNSDVHQAMDLCLAAAAEAERVLRDPEPKCLLIEFGDNSVNLQVRFWIADAHNGVQNVKSAVLLAIWDKFKAAGIEIPYPQRDLHLRSGFENLGQQPSVR